MKELYINKEYITLGQMLKEENIISSGGQAKWYLRENIIKINNEIDDRRGRKLYPEDIIEVEDLKIIIKNEI